MTNSALFCDFYELTMAQGFWKNKSKTRAVFEMFFRSNPFNGGYSIFAGLEPLLKCIENFHFSDDDINWLESYNIFEKDFLEYLRYFKFTGNIWAMDEGTIIFPNEPIIRIEADEIEAILLEGLVLNTINFQSLIATKTSRLWLASQRGSIVEFGLRRAQGYDGAMSATRAAYIGGAFGTSNSLAAKNLNIPAFGTMAHSWIMSFETEEDAFRSYANLYPDNSIFLIDTYDTLNSGIVNAIKVGKELQKKGKVFGVRLDSGDISYLSNAVRKKLDEAGCYDAIISASNELTEEIIESLVNNNTPIDSWGIGTNMVTGGSESSFTGVYKMVARKIKGKDEWQPVMKFSDNPQKMTNPAIKQVWRLYDEQDRFHADVMSFEDEEIKAGVQKKFYHPANDYQFFEKKPNKIKPLLNQKMKNGKLILKLSDLKEVKNYVAQQFDQLDQSTKRMLNPHIYKVSLTEKMKKLKMKLIDDNFTTIKTEKEK